MNSWVIDSRIRFKRSLLWALLLHAALALLAFLVLRQAVQNTDAVIDLTFSMAPVTAPPIEKTATRSKPKKEWTVSDTKTAPIPDAAPENPEEDNLPDCPYPCPAREGDYVSPSAGMRLPRSFGALIRESDYPREAKREGLEGTVVARLFIDADGSVKKVDIILSNDPRFSEVVTKRLLEARFRPARNEAGLEIPVRVEIPIRFTLK